MADAIREARKACRRKAWRDAFEAFAAAAKRTALAPADLERWATAAYLAGRDDAYRDLLEQAHQANLRAGEPLRAIRCAFWLGLFLLFRGENGAATGWLGRAARELERLGRPCAEQGYLKLPAAEQRLAQGDAQEGFSIAAQAAAIGERFSEGDLTAAARHQQGRALLLRGRVDEGLALLDEAMVAVTSGELTPIMTGLLYCSVIDACWQVYELGRAREWTSAMSRWCEAQAQMVAFRGTCQVHRAEIMQLRGDWGAAFDEACAACAWPGSAADREAPGAALYQQAEVQRLRGERAAAEKAYRAAAVRGYEPQPGLALLRLAEGRVGEAAAALTRVLGAAAEPNERARLLPAQVEVLVRLGKTDEARRACDELAQLAQRFRSPVVRAMAAQAEGTVELAAGNARAALPRLRSARREWERIQAPYPCARVRELLALACEALGDAEAGRTEREAARAAFERLGAAADLARLDSSGPPRRGGRDALTGREADVLRLVAAGKTNKSIARELRLSVKTVDRHLSNVFGKLDVSSRAAAIAQAYKRKLL